MRIDPINVQLKNEHVVTLRSPEIADAAEVLKHLKRVSQESYKNLNFDPKSIAAMTIEQEEKILKDFLDSSDKFMLTAFASHVPIGNLGFMSLGKGFQKSSARIGMGIEKAFQSIGLGTALLQHTINFAKKVGFHRVELTVRTYNQAGIALYESVGFEKVGLLKEVALIDGQFVDELMYQKII